MPTTIAEGLSASWLNEWMAAIGAAYLTPDLHVSWSPGPSYRAVLTHPDADVASAIAARFPSLEALERLGIANVHPDSPVRLDRKVTLEAYRARCTLARNGDPSLSWLVTDLARGDDGSLQTSPFAAPGPGTVGSLHDRVLACRREIDDVEASIRRTLEGRASRVNRFGLGFDYRRIVSPTDPGGGNWVDPVVETLAFYALAFHPVRGPGHPLRGRPQVRGWTAPPTRVGAYRWPAWGPPLDAAAIDALLDQFAAAGSTWPDGVVAVWETVPYQALGSADPTRGFASRLVQSSRGFESSGP